MRKILMLVILFLSVGVSANSHNSAYLGMQNNANSAASFNYIPNMMGTNNWPVYGGASNWLPYNNNTNMMQMMGGANTTYLPYNYTMPYMPNNNWMAGVGNNNWGSFGAYNNMMPMMGVSGAMPYTNYNNTMPNTNYNNTMPNTNYNNTMLNNMGMNQTNMNTGLGFNQTPATPELTNAWGSLDANAAWGLSGNLNFWDQQTQTSDLSSQDPADVIARLMSGENAAIYQKIIADAYEKGFADAMVQSGSGGICIPAPVELPEFNLESE